MITNPNDQAVGFNGPHLIVYGLTKREYFAAMAMQGVMFWDATVNEPDKTGKIEELAKNAIEMADALIAELNK